LGGLGGLGAFQGAGASPQYGGGVTLGLLTSAEAITHIVDEGQLSQDVPPHGNIGRWSDWVRGSLYLTEYCRHLDWSYQSNRFTLDFDGPVYRVDRPGHELLNGQVREIRKYVDQRAERAAEITSQLGFPTPYFAMALGLHPGHYKYTGELVAVTQVMAAHSAMIVKNALCVPRPDFVSAKVLPMIATPGHGSFPSAHATEAFAVAEVLKAILDVAVNAHADRDNRVALVDKQAERIAVNRTVAGVHYPIDTWAGATLGRIVGKLILRLCGQGGQVGDRHYMPKAHDFFVNDFTEAFETPSGDGPINTHGEGSSVSQTPHFTWLWGKMVEEFA
jgi:hypothetical protein